VSEASDVKVTRREVEAATMATPNVCQLLRDNAMEAHRALSHEGAFEDCEQYPCEAALHACEHVLTLDAVGWRVLDAKPASNEEVALAASEATIPDSVRQLDATKNLWLLASGIQWAERRLLAALLDEEG
jgi:hypothetical protein